MSGEGQVRKFWTTGEHLQLRQLYCVERKTCKQIARVLVRSPCSVKKKIFELGLRKAKRQPKVRKIGNLVWLRKVHQHFEFVENLWPKSYSYNVPPIHLN